MKPFRNALYSESVSSRASFQAAKSTGPSPSPMVEPNRFTLPSDAIPAFLLLCDVLIVIPAVYFAFKITMTTVGFRNNTPLYLHILLIMLPAVPVTLSYLQFYSSSHILNRPDQVRIIGKSCPILLLIATLVVLPVTGTIGQALLWAFAFLVAFVGLMTTARLATSRQLEKLAYAGRIERSIVIIGGSQRGCELIATLERLRQPWTRILGVFEDRRRPGTPTRVMGYPVLGTIADLVPFTRHTRVDEIVIALPWSAEARIQEILGRIGEIPANIHMGPDQIVQSSPNSRMVDLDGMQTLNVMAKPLGSGNWIIKGIEDFVVAAIAVTLLSPLLLLIALAIKLDSPGPVFFRQKRCGFNNNLIEVFKFRTMHHHLADNNADRLTTRNDPRVTRLGRFLRRSSLDELPQLFNVLRGEMSIVGPRPHALHAKADGRLYQSVVDNYARRHKIRPGITGWAQINGWRGETDTADKIIRRVEFDSFYMENWSLSLDLYIIFMTAFALINTKEAY